MVVLSHAICSQIFGVEKGWKGLCLDAANKTTSLITLLSSCHSYTVIRGMDGKAIQILNSTPVDIVDFIGRTTIGLLSVLFIVPFVFGLSYKFVHIVHNREIYDRVLTAHNRVFHFSLGNLATIPSDILSDAAVQQIAQSILTTQKLVIEMDTLIPFTWNARLEILCRTITDDPLRERIKRQLKKVADEAENVDRNAPIPYVDTGWKKFRDELQQYLKLIIVLLQSDKIEEESKINIVGSLYNAFMECPPTWLRITRAIVDQYYRGENPKEKWLRCVQALKNKTLERVSSTIVRREFSEYQDAIHHHLDHEILNKVQYDIYPNRAVAQRDRLSSQVKKVSDYCTRERCLEEFYRFYTPHSIGEGLEDDIYIYFNEESEEEKTCIIQAMKTAYTSGDMKLYWIPPLGWEIPVRGNDTAFDAAYNRENNTFTDLGYFTMSERGIRLTFQRLGPVIRGIAKEAEPPQGAIRLIAHDECHIEAFIKACIATSYNFTSPEGFPNKPTDEYPLAGRSVIRGIGKHIAVSIGVLTPPK